MDFNVIFNSLPDPIVVLSPEYVILGATDVYLHTTMRSREQLVGQHFLLEAFPKKELSYGENPVKLALDRVVETKEAVQLDVLRYDIAKPESEGSGYDVRYWESSHIPVLDVNGQVKYIMQKATDVTEREITKKTLSEVEEKFRFMAETMPQLIFTADRNGRVNYFNRKWEDYTGRTIKDLLESNWQEIIHPEDVKDASDKWEGAMKTGIELQIEIRKRDKSGDYRWHLSRATPMKDKSGHVSMWVYSSIDIHDTRKMVHELLESNEQLVLLSDQVQLAYEKAESERRNLEALILEAPALFCVTKGPNHQYELVNKRYQQLFEGRELLGKPVAEALPEIVDQGFIELLDNVYKSGETYIAEEILAMLDKDNDGQLEEGYFTFSFQPIRDGEMITGILIFAYEVTEQVKFKQKLTNFN